MKYSQKVKKASTILTAIQSLKDGESISVTYGTDREGKANTYKIRAYSDYKNNISYSIWNSYSGMNISKVGKTSLTAYTYDMMHQKTTYRFDLLKMKMGVMEVNKAA